MVYYIGTTFFVPDVTASAESTAAAETTVDLLAGATQQDPCGSSGSSGSVSACAIYAQSVVPAQGSILCFPHGTVEGERAVCHYMHTTNCGI